MWPELFRAAWRAALRPLRTAWRRGFIYRSLLKGKLTDHIAFYPHDALPRRLEDAEALLRGRFRFAGETVEVKEGSIFDKEPPSRAWAESLHGFAWLPPLSAAGGDAARTLATNLITQWIKRQPRYSEPAWEAAVIARRLAHIFAHGRLVLANSDIMWRSKLFVSLREQARLLARTAGQAPDGSSRFEAAAMHALSGACLDDSPKRLASGLARLEAEIARQILPDGGHVSRSPEAMVHAYRHLTMVSDALAAIGHPVPAALRSALDRMAPMVRFFRHGDGALALFHGGTESDARVIAGLLARDDVRGQPFVYAPHSGYQRMTASRSLVVLDCGAPPKDAFSNEAHSSCLAFEFSTAQQRIVVNCGAAGPAHAKWEGALRATAAHSTVTLADTSVSSVLQPGFARNMLGARLLGGPHNVETNRLETQHGWCVETSHDGYAAPFGIMHRRKITLSPQGLVLTGGDTLTPSGRGRREAVTFAVRFHIHPDVRVSPSQGGAILLKLPNGEGWRFRAGGGALAIEESVYLGSDTVRRTDQLVVSGTVANEPVDIAWTFEQIGAG